MTTHAPAAPSAAPDPDEPFFIGYLPAAPRAVRRRVRAAVAITLAASLLAAGLLAAAFRSPGRAVWEAQPTEFIGRLIEHPYPMLRLIGPDSRAQRALLVQTGKHGAAGRIAGLDSAPARIRGTLLHRDGRLLIEIADDPEALTALPADAPALPSPAAPAPLKLGDVTLTGEIVDPKCFLGAMKPGDGHLHKACAIRCISGGIPPMLVTRDEHGPMAYYLLVDHDGRPAHRRLLPFVGEPVQVSGEAFEVEGQRQLRLFDDAAAVRRLVSVP